MKNIILKYIIEQFSSNIPKEKRISHLNRLGEFENWLINKIIK